MDLKALVEQLVALSKKFNRKQQYVIVGTLLTVIALISFLIVYTTPEQKRGDDGFRVLFSQLSSKDAGLIVAHLEQNKVEYKIPDDGTIEVRKEVVNKTRMDIAALGLPKESMAGFELFDTQEFGATDFDQNVKFLRALEGELSRTIGDLTAVKSARVHIALPKESVFVSKEQPPSASVIVELHDNMQLSRKQIMGVKNLVAAAVVKLEVENVKLVNENGDPLGEEDELTTAGEVARMQLKYKKDYEKFYEQKIVNMLSPFIGGEDKVVAKVTIDFDFSQKESVEEVYDPNSVPRSEQSMEEKREGYKPKEIGGVPGAVSNIGPVQGLESNELKEKYQKSQSTTNYEISKKTSNIKGEFATINRVTAAVVVDGRYNYEGEGEARALVYTPRDETEIEAIKNLVQQSIGYNPSRQDEVTVSNFEFRPPELDAKVKLSPIELFLQRVQMMTGPFYPAFKYIFLIIVLFIFYKKVIVPFSEKMLELKAEEEEPEEVKIEFEEEEFEDEMEKLNELKKKIEQQLGLGGEADEESLRYDVLLERMRTMAEEKPEDLASIITQLMHEEVIKSSVKRGEG